MRRMIVSVVSRTYLYVTNRSYIPHLLPAQYSVRVFSLTKFLNTYRGALTNGSVNKTLGAMTGLEFDNIDVLGPVNGRVGMGYFDCFCVPSISSAPPTPENPNPASSRHCTS